MSKVKELTIPFEVADGIVLASLKEQLKFLKKELKNYEAGSWMHPEDADKSRHELIPSLKILIKYYGGNVE
jgi:hypothetical protein